LLNTFAIDAVIAWIVSGAVNSDFAQRSGQK